MYIRDAAMKWEELILERAIKKNGKGHGNPISEVAEEVINAVGYYNNNRGGFHDNNGNNPENCGNNNKGNNRGGQTTQMSNPNDQNACSSNRRNFQTGGRQTEEVDVETIPREEESKTQASFTRCSVNSVEQKVTGELSATLESIVKDAKIENKIQSMRTTMNHEHEQEDYYKANEDVSSIFGCIKGEPLCSNNQ